MVKEYRIKISMTREFWTLHLDYINWHKIAWKDSGQSSQDLQGERVLLEQHQTYCYRQVYRLGFMLPSDLKKCTPITDYFRTDT